MFDLVIESGLVRTSANRGIDASSRLGGPVTFTGRYILIMVLADVGIAEITKLGVDDASLF